MDEDGEAFWERVETTRTTLRAAAPPPAALARRLTTALFTDGRRLRRRMTLGVPSALVVTSSYAILTGWLVTRGSFGS